jgi:tetratricopeptide (TPR) repeat protein
VTDLASTLKRLCAENQFAKALHHYLDHADSLTDADSLFWAATAAARVGEYPIARVRCEAALVTFRLDGNDAGRMRALNLQGGIAFEQGCLAEAEVCFREALTLAFEIADESQQARLWNNLGLVAQVRGIARVPLELYAKALGVYRRQQDSRGIAQTAHNMAIQLRTSGAFERAVAYADEAVEQSRDVGDPALTALVTLGRAELAIETAQYDEAAKDVRRGLDLAAGSRDHLGVAEGMRLQAVIALKQGRLESARDHAEAAYTQAADLGAALTAAECSAVWSLALKGLERPIDAWCRYRETMAGFERLGARQPLERFLERWAAA